MDEINNIIFAKSRIHEYDEMGIHEIISDIIINEEITLENAQWVKIKENGAWFLTGEIKEE